MPNDFDEKDYAEAKAKLSAMHDQIMAHDKHLKQMQRHEQSLKEANTRLAEENVLKSRELEQVSSNLEAQKAAVVSSQKLRTEIKEDITSLQTTKSDLESELNTQRAELQNTKSNVHAELKKLDTSKAELRAFQSEVQQQIDQNNSDVAELNAKEKELRDTLLVELENVRQKSKELTSKLLEVEDTKIELNTAKSEHSAKISKYQSLITQFEEKSKELQAAVDKLAADQKTLEQENTKLLSLRNIIESERKRVEYVYLSVKKQIDDNRLDIKLEKLRDEVAKNSTQ